MSYKFKIGDKVKITKINDELVKHDMAVGDEIEIIQLIASLQNGFHCYFFRCRQQCKVMISEEFIEAIFPSKKMSGKIDYLSVTREVVGAKS